MMHNEELFSEEEFSLFNPAFTGFNLYHGVREFCSVDGSGMHCALPFILIPMSLNVSINSMLPSTYRTPISSWVASNEGLLATFSLQAESYIPIVRSAFEFLLSYDLIRLSSSGSFLLGEESLPVNPRLFNQSHDMKSALKASRFLGKWFAHAQSAETIYAQFGVKP
ncbi:MULTISPECIES: three component ABC system middle component [unclassified Halomonas]|uniref:three component ABC system middle component n=1 Tax=unclassified Halomonas TaxID=2609666 RepID=UPI0011B93F2B|nr:three component ABC system middle component [Halomonas sp. SL1]